ncbi:hypothetical protein MTR67_036061 [Solanum verrucosum]|uniref:K-box domain-containing protein n=1 Tax=Solanum verrucosum TaxID=315347 RepID=A0AAF0ZKJ6_SOLVR|nr:hypothetical protein MTR67_036061 [Solanum verrucosum]
MKASRTSRNPDHKFWSCACPKNLDNEINKVKKDNDNMQIELKHLKGEDISSFNSCRALMILEDALENGLTRIRDKQNEFLRMMRKKRQLEIASINRNIGEIGEVFEQTTNAFCLESPT